MWTLLLRIYVFYKPRAYNKSQILNVRIFGKKNKISFLVYTYTLPVLWFLFFHLLHFLDLFGSFQLLLGALVQLARLDLNELLRIYGRLWGRCPCDPCPRHIGCIVLWCLCEREKREKNNGQKCIYMCVRNWKLNWCPDDSEKCNNVKLKTKHVFLIFQNVKKNWITKCCIYSIRNR